MTLPQYQQWAKEIRLLNSKIEQYRLYVKLMEIFVTDCWLTGVEPYYANRVKEKANILFELQELFV